MKNKLIKLTVLTVGSLSFTSCGTVNGLGQDFQKVGSGFQKSAQGGIFGSRAVAYQVPNAQAAPATRGLRGGIFGSRAAAYPIPAYEPPTYPVPR